MWRLFRTINLAPALWYTLQELSIPPIQKQKRVGLFSVSQNCEPPTTNHSTCFAFLRWYPSSTAFPCFAFSSWTSRNVALSRKYSRNQRRRLIRWAHQKLQGIQHQQVDCTKTNQTKKHQEETESRNKGAIMVVVLVFRKHGSIGPTYSEQASPHKEPPHLFFRTRRTWFFGDEGCKRLQLRMVAKSFSHENARINLEFCEPGRIKLMNCVNGTVENWRVEFVIIRWLQTCLTSDYISWYNPGLPGREPHLTFLVKTVEDWKQNIRNGAPIQWQSRQLSFFELRPENNSIQWLWEEWWMGKLTRWIGSGLIVTQVCYFKNAGDCKIQLRTHFLNLLMLQSRMTSKIHLHLSALVKKRYIPLWHSSIWSVFFCSKILIDVTYQLFRESHGIGGPEIEMKIIME